MAAPVDRHGLARRVEALHQRLRAVARDAADHDEVDVGLGRLHEAVPRVAVARADDEQVGQRAVRDPPELLLPAHQRRRGGGDRAHEVLAGEVGVLVLDRVPGDLQLLQQVLAPGRGPVAADRERHLRVGERLEVERAAVQQLVAERRPHDLGALVGEQLEVVAGQPQRVDPDQVGRDQVALAQVVEVHPARGVDALGQVVEADLPRERLAERLVLLLVAALAQLQVGYVGGRVRQLRVAALLDVAHDPVVELEAAADLRLDPLAGGRAADHRLGLDVADQRARGLERAGDRLDRLRDLGRVARRAPLAAVVVALGQRPQRADVVGEVVVEVDQAGVDRALGVDHRGAGEGGRQLVAVLDDVGDAAAADRDLRAVEVLAGLRHRGHAAAQHVRVVHQLPFGACQISVCPSSGTGRETALWPPCSRSQESSPRKAGTPNGRSRRGIAAWSASLNLAP